MNLDEFAFFNQQLAAMLRSGMPLEGALQQLSASMRRSELRTGLEQLQAKLRQGVPLKEALAGSSLPRFYVQMLTVGVTANNLPGVLTLVADYYQKVNAIWARLKGLMVYPLIVTFAMFTVSFWLALLWSRWMLEVQSVHRDLRGDFALPALTEFMIRYGPIGFWLPVVVLGLVALGLAVACASPTIRQYARWRLPAFRDASLWQLAAGLTVLVEGGCPLNEALQLVGELEAGSAAQADLERWQQRLAAGHGTFPAMAEGSRVVPPLFVWIVACSGDNLAAGFKRAAEIFHDRALRKTEAMLYAVLPVSVLVLGTLILIQALTMIYSVLGTFLPLITF